MEPSFHAFEQQGWGRAADHYGDAFGSLTSQTIPSLLSAAGVGKGFESAVNAVASWQERLAKDAAGQPLLPPGMDADAYNEEHVATRRVKDIGAVIDEIRTLRDRH